MLVTGLIDQRRSQLDFVGRASGYRETTNELERLLEHQRSLTGRRKDEVFGLRKESEQEETEETERLLSVNSCWSILVSFLECWMAADGRISNVVEED